MTFFEKLITMLFSNWKTTAIGLAAGLAVLANDYGIVLSQGVQDKISGWIIALGVALLGIVSKDGDTPPANPVS